MERQPIPWEHIEALLHRVRRPGRYVGGEVNAVHKPWEATDVHVCLAFPDIYDLGMSNFALAILYDVLNRRPDVLAERTYLPAPDMIAEMRAADLPLYTLESYRPVAAFDLLGISTAYEQLYTNALVLLDLAGLPIRAADRDARHPLVIGGGHGTFNPEPITDFFDAFVIGEGEEIIVEIVEVLRQIRDLPREAQLRRLASLDGLYVPRFYQVRYASDGTLDQVTPTAPEASARVRKRITERLPPTPVNQLVPNIDVVHDRGVVEIQRGCTRGCRFCQAGAVTRPVRERSAEEIVRDVERLVDVTGYEEIALLSLSSADHSEIQTLLPRLQKHFADRQLSFSLPSLRIDAFSVDLADGLTGSRKSGFTFAPEAGTERLRRRINKEITDEELLSVAEEVFERGWRTLKLYFMIGLPGETDEDITAIADLARQVRSIGRRVGGRKTEVHVSVSTFVPKPQTVFQWEPLADEATIRRRQALLRSSIRGRGFRLSWNDYAESQLEALLARGDRRLNAVVARAWELGARFDAWQEWRDFDAWQRAFEEHGVDPHFYLYRRRDPEEVLPWDHLHSGVEKRFFWRDYRRSLAGEFLSDCRERCHGCGVLQNYPSLSRETWQCPS
ncbi:MAG: TIGR03960 family B12-binding radical SAM protein [Anaerolineae bacterium]